jgi:predicted transcriptional regulator
MVLPTVAPMSLRLDADLKERLNKIAEVQKRSAHALARNASCRASLDEYRETGLHITHEELDAWLDTWGTTNEKPGPECHE